MTFNGRKARSHAYLNDHQGLVVMLFMELRLKWFTEFGHLNRGGMLTSEQHRCTNEKKKF